MMLHGNFVFKICVVQHKYASTRFVWNDFIQTSCPSLLRQPRSYMADHQGDCPQAMNETISTLVLHILFCAVEHHGCIVCHLIHCQLILLQLYQIQLLHHANLHLQISCQ